MLVNLFSYELHSIFHVFMDIFINYSLKDSKIAKNSLFNK